MGNNCSHTDLTIDSNNLMSFDPNTPGYMDSTKTWKYEVTNCKCKECGLSGRAIKKTCIDHNISQSWNLVMPNDCVHNILQVNEYNYNSKNKTLKGRAKCMICLTSIPAIAEFRINYDSNNNQTLLVSKWSTDKPKYLDELKTIRENNENKLKIN
jgi:hypothetical protein